MKFTTFSILAASATSLCSALPAELTDFLLVTYNSTATPPGNSTQDIVSATSLFDPYYQEPYLLRLIGPGYGSLPRFNLSSGTLSSWASGPHGQGYYLYNSSSVTAGTEFQLLPHEQPAGNIALDDAGLLTVGGAKEGWTLCDGKLSETVLFWKGADASCKSTFVHAVQDPPY
ncbi:hypothetical protein BDV96DRAFT_498950 [Lophiotrema nucula]|uniref:Cell wall protein PhiA n=1 Tax=Lophiotrema nucula TaxID=690887 RepID=A0A6A5YYH7_9PLEO|nr:hypothetical protein BDV96DRAFT_498950 [Lophiotrema nucula]